MSDFDILTSTRAWVAVPWDFNSCIGLRFRSDGSGDMVFARIQIVRAEIKFRSGIARLPRGADLRPGAIFSLSNATGGYGSHVSRSPYVEVIPISV